MAHFAQVDGDGVVQQVIVVDNSVVSEPDVEFPATEAAGQAFISQVLGLSGRWLQTSYNGNIRGCYAGIGYIYDEENDVFVPPATVENHDT